MSVDASADVGQIRVSLLIDADPDEVFDYFIDPELVVQWMGQWAELDARPGGRLALDINGAAVRGTFIEVERPSRLVFSWGFANSDELPPAASTVEVTLTAARGGTQLELVHAGLPDRQAREHRRGWVVFLGRLADQAASPTLP